MFESLVIKRIATCLAALGCFVGLAGFGEFPPMREFPGIAAQNDTLCRSYGYAPGTHLYRLCRERKDQISADSRAASVPDVTPIPLLLFLDKRPAW
ncbi:MAG: hypothetical protein EPN75_00805 [Beijerinckiaceae bacterium]|nr:MAG: hypothetical protein EPN75_00805 [Beijerinckiaceae bacterium]